MGLYEYAFDIILSLIFREEFSYGLRTRKLATFIHSHSLFPFATNRITITQLTIYTDNSRLSLGL